jgi:hypothetical protein
VISRRTAELAFAGTTALFGAVIAYGATEFGVGWSPSGPEPGTFPFYIGCLIAAASLGNLAFALKPGQHLGLEFLSREQLGRILHFVLPIFGFVIATLFLGLYVATALYMLFVMLVQGRYPLWHAALVAIGMPLALFFILEKGFQVPLLKGPLEAALGL